jgi:signal transduction histidine kinase
LTDKTETTKSKSENATGISQVKTLWPQVGETAAATDQVWSAYLVAISHDLRSPLNSVIGYSELLLQEAQALNLTEFATDLDYVQQAGHRLLAMIDRMTEMARIEMDEVTFELTPFSLADLLDSVITKLNPQVERNKNELDLTYSEDLGMMLADRTKVHRILVELVGNATKFTKQGYITLKATRTGDDGSEQICFQVGDTGIGMSRAQLQNIFRPFILVDKSIRRKYGGSGLGLAISYAYCRMMGGDITVVSELAQGTTFTVSLPAVVTHPCAS